MHARSTTFHANRESIDAGIAYIRDDVWPALQAMDGCVGLSMMVDRESGRCIATSAWTNQEAMWVAARRVRPLRDRAAEIMGADTDVDEWEIAYMHRDHPTPEGACVRATWMRMDPASMDRALDIFRLASLPAMEDLPGFCSASMFIDRSRGRAVSSATYDSRETMESSRERAEELRTEGTREAGAEVIDVAEFELALAHLHVPEMA
jgi:hypothetical protein